ncbi:MAG: helix-turn-helix domain-containing protein [Gallintestinimicrobium sp.]
MKKKQVGDKMKRKQEKPAYDRIAAGERLRCRRLELGWSRELVAERLGVVNKYYADIERGTCGMSVETLINLSRLYGVSLDTLIYGEKEKKSAASQEEHDARITGCLRQDYRLDAVAVVMGFGQHRRKLQQNTRQDRRP